MKENKLIYRSYNLLIHIILIVNKRKKGKEEKDNRKELKLQSILYLIKLSHYMTQNLILK